MGEGLGWKDCFKFRKKERFWILAFRVKGKCHYMVTICVNKADWYVLRYRAEEL